MTSAPKCSACARISPISSGPMIPALKPGKFSTSVVSISCPPASRPSMIRGLRFARAVYRAAGRPAGPDPMTMTLRTSHTLLGNGLVDDLLQHILVGDTYDLCDDLTALEEEQRGDAADAELGRGVRVVVDVQLADHDLAVVIPGELVHRRRQALAGPAPFRPEVHQDGLAAVDRAVEVRVGNRLNLVG